MVTVGQKKFNEEAVKLIFSFVHNNNAYSLFKEAVRKEFKQAGHPVDGPLELLRKKYTKGFIKRIFKQAKLKELEDYLVFGENSYRGTAKEYRLSGVWKVGEELWTVCKKHPLVSSTVIAAITFAGLRWPFFGGLSGGIILVCSSIGTLYNELKARSIPKMNKKKAKHYVSSGENIANLILTMIGIDGIWKSFADGKRAWHAAEETVKAYAPLKQYALKTKAAFLSKTKESYEGQSITNLSRELRFVLRLFDNVLIPFHSLAEFLNKRGTAHQGCS